MCTERNTYVPLIWLQCQCMMYINKLKSPSKRFEVKNTNNLSIFIFVPESLNGFRPGSSAVGR